MASKKELTGYRFLDKDPIIDVYREALRKSGMDEATIHDLGGPTVATLNNWDHGDTRKPQRLSIAYAMLAMGYHEQWCNFGNGDVITTLFKSLPGVMKVDNVVPIQQGKRKVAATARPVKRINVKG